VKRVQEPSIVVARCGDANKVPHRRRIDEGNRLQGQRRAPVHGVDAIDVGRHGRRHRRDDPLHPPRGVAVGRQREAGGMGGRDRVASAGFDRAGKPVPDFARRARHGRERVTGQRVEPHGG
jgi:hypothetical protein